MDGSMVAFLSLSSFIFRFFSLATQLLTLLAAEGAAAGALDAEPLAAENTPVSTAGGAAARRAW